MAQPTIKSVREEEMQRMLSALVIVVAAGSLPSIGKARTFNAAFAFTGVRVCTFSDTPFKNDVSGAPTIIAGRVSRLEAMDSGQFVFKIDGTGTISGRGDELDIVDANVGDSISQLIEFSAPFTYVINPDNSLVVNFAQETFRILLGVDVKDTGTVSPRTDVFQLAEGDGSFVSASKAGLAQETVHFNATNFTEYRLCTRSGVRVRLM